MASPKKYLTHHNVDLVVAGSTAVVALWLLYKGSTGGHYVINDQSREDALVVGERTLNTIGSLQSIEYLVKLQNRDAFATIPRTYRVGAPRIRVGGLLTVVERGDGQFVDEAQIAQEHVQRLQRSMVVVGLAQGWRRIYHQQPWPSFCWSSRRCLSPCRSPNGTTKPRPRFFLFAVDGRPCRSRCWTQQRSTSWWASRSTRPSRPSIVTNMDHITLAAADHWTTVEPAPR